MCFNQSSSFLFSFIGIAGTVYCWKATKNFRLTVGVFFFFLMEFLQGIQYFFIDDCDSNVNKFLTLVGMLHICLQPFFTHYMISGLVLTPKGKAVYSFILRMALIGCFGLLIRWPLSYIPYFRSSDNILEGFQHGPHPKDGPLLGSDAPCGRSPEWIRGNEICTYSGKQHLGWSVPLSGISYYIPSSFIHFFTMFAPFLALKQNMWVYGVFLFLSGPFAARLLTDDLQEQASIWCFWSMLQVLAMVFAIRYFFNNPKLHEKFRKQLEEDKKRESDSQKVD